MEEHVADSYQSCDITVSGVGCGRDDCLAAVYEGTEERVSFYACRVDDCYGHISMHGLFPVE